MEMICAIIYQLTKNLTPEQIEKSGFAPYYIDHTTGLYPVVASGTPFTATYFQLISNLKGILLQIYMKIWQQNKRQDQPMITY